MFRPNRRDFLRLGTSAAFAGLAGTLAHPHHAAFAQAPTLAQPLSRPAGVAIVGPRARVPASFIIDDSTCLVNMGHFCLPQFAEAWPNRDEYKKPWNSWPREIPDTFVREFGEWCAEHGVKGKYSVVPYPACVGWLDRELPGWSRRQLRDSLKLVRELFTPHWDIHPEMITHTRVIDLTTGRPFDEISAATMENSYPQVKKSADEMAAYLAYALRILKNCDLPCEGVTTPGGFGNLVKPELSLAAFQAVREVYGAELPHYFKYVHEGDRDTWPIPEHVSGLDTDQPRVVMNVPAATGDWFGGWDGDRASEGQRYANDDASAGRMVDLIEREQPAVMLCHWPGLYSHGTKAGLHDFQRVIRALEQRYPDRLVWMKTSELARYGAARALTQIARPADDQLTLRAPYACPAFTLRLQSTGQGPWTFQQGPKSTPLVECRTVRELAPGRWHRDGKQVHICMDLPKGESSISG